MSDLKKTILRKARYKTKRDESSEVEKRKQEAEILTKTAEFLAKGGNIDYIPLGKGTQGKFTARQIQAFATELAKRKKEDKSGNKN